MSEEAPVNGAVVGAGVLLGAVSCALMLVFAVGIVIAAL